ncbi:MAG TPA: L,D-transpeptidase family protein [Candidatus Acidoferrum sp.]|nr:L,D-transpeptidase family protein [Candidatus Acidoferrum sp.]
MRSVRRLVFVFVIVGLLAAVPLSAVASESILSTDLRQAEVAFNQSFLAAVRGGLDKGAADNMMWQYSQVTAMKPSAWWQAPIADHNKLDELSQLSQVLDATYQQQVADSRDALQRQLHLWNQMLADAQNAGVSADGLDASTARFANYGALATTPKALLALSSVISDQYSILDGRMAAYRTARDQVDAAAQTAKTLLAGAGQYPQLSLSGFAASIGAATDSLPSVHSAEAFGPILAQLQQTAAGIQGLLNARTNAYNQLADTRSTLASAQSIGAALANHPSTINYLAGQLPGASDQGTFQSISSQLYQEKQALASAIYLKQQVPVSYNAGVGKVIVISLSRQVLTAYQDGNAILTTFVATGRPQLPTPPGVYHIFARYSPYQMISPWPYGSPYWYPNSWTNWAMEFRGGGYFIHDAPWRSWYGPGANLYNGTHGCVNVPYSPMATLWNWAPNGTTVVVQY